MPISSRAGGKSRDIARNWNFLRKRSRASKRRRVFCATSRHSLWHLPVTKPGRCMPQRPWAADGLIGLSNRIDTHDPQDHKFHRKTIKEGLFRDNRDVI